MCKIQRQTATNRKWQQRHKFRCFCFLFAKCQQYLKEINWAKNLNWKYKNVTKQMSDLCSFLFVYPTVSHPKCFALLIHPFVILKSFWFFYSCNDFFSHIFFLVSKSQIVVWAFSCLVCVSSNGWVYFSRLNINGIWKNCKNIFISANHKEVK